MMRKIKGLTFKRAGGWCEPVGVLYFRLWVPVRSRTVNPLP